MNSYLVTFELVKKVSKDTKRVKTVVEAFNVSAAESMVIDKFASPDSVVKVMLVESMPPAKWVTP